MLTGATDNYTSEIRSIAFDDSSIGIPVAHTNVGIPLFLTDFPVHFFRLNLL